MKRSAEAPPPDFDSRVRHLRWRERIASVVGLAVPMKDRTTWAAASGESVSWMNSCASPADADRRTLRLVDVLFLPKAARDEILMAIDEWAAAIDRGDL